MKSITRFFGQYDNTPCSADVMYEFSLTSNAHTRARVLSPFSSTAPPPRLSSLGFGGTAFESRLFGGKNASQFAVIRV